MSEPTHGMLKANGYGWVIKRAVGYFAATLIGALITLSMFELAYPAHLDQGLHFYELWRAAPTFADFTTALNHCGIGDVLTLRLIVLGIIYLLVYASFVRTEIVRPLRGRSPIQREVPKRELFVYWFYMGVLFFAITGYVTSIDRFTQPRDCKDLGSLMPLRKLNDF